MIPRQPTPHAWLFCPKTDVLFRAFYDEQQRQQYRLHHPQVYRAQKYYRTEEVISKIDPCYISVETIDFLEYARIRGGAPINKKVADLPPGSFEEHIHRLPEYLQSIIGRVSYSEDELDAIANRIIDGKIMFFSDGSIAEEKGTSAYKMVGRS